MRFVCPECGATGEPGTCPSDGAVRVPAGNDPMLGTTIGSWRIASMLGIGGMGRVYTAVQPEIGARVAIKVLRRESVTDGDSVDRFFNEARAVNLIRHDNIIDIIDLGRLADGSPYIVMEHLDGAPLSRVFKPRGGETAARLPLKQLVRIIDDVLAALEAAHDKNIIHRDLKPDNVFVSPGGRVTVLDFGIAKLAAAEGMAATRTGSVLGTPAYMSPEQARSRGLDARADLYSVGVMLYEGATRVLPFTADNLYDLLHMQVETAPPEPRQHDPAIPASLEAVILRALAKQPSDRFASATEMRRALAAVVGELADQPYAWPASAGSASARPTSDPQTPTAPGTQPSLAHSDTMPSSPPTKPEPATPVSIQLSRKMLVGLVTIAALLGLGGAVIVMTVTRSRSAVVAAPSRPIDAQDDAFEDGVLPLPNPSAVDVVAYYKTALAAAEHLGGKVYPIKLTWRHVDATGHMDVTHGGSAEYFFFSPENAKAGKACLLLVFLENGEARIAASVNEGAHPCDVEVIAPPRCTVPQLWAQAVAKKLPATVKLATLNHMNRGTWVFSGEMDNLDSMDLDDDCR